MSNAAGRDGSASKNGSYCCASPNCSLFTLAFAAGLSLVMVSTGCGGLEDPETTEAQTTDVEATEVEASDATRQATAVYAPRPRRIYGHHTLTSPALAYHNRRLHLVYEGGKLWYSTSRDGRNWSTREPLQHVSSAPPALAVFRGRLYMVYPRGKSGYLNYASLGSRWGSRRQISGKRSAKKVGLAVYNNRLHMVYLRRNTKELWHTSFDGSRWSTSRRIWGQSAKAAPALAALGTRLHMVHLGNKSDDIWYSTYRLGRWTSNVRVGSPSYGCGILSGIGKPASTWPKVASSSTPALVATNGRLEMIYRDRCGRKQIYQASYRRGSWSPHRIVKHKGFKTGVAPAAAVFGSKMHMVFRGSTSSSIYHGYRYNAPYSRRR